MNRYGQRRYLEACHINMNHHALNRDDGRSISATEWRPCWQITSPLKTLDWSVETLGRECNSTGRNMTGKGICFKPSMKLQSKRNNTYPQGYWGDHGSQITDERCTIF